MRAIDRKLVRDLFTMKSQAIAIALVIGCGVSAFVMALSTMTSLNTTRAAYYQEQRFGDIFARLKRAPNALADRIAEIPGVLRVQTRVEVEIILDMPDMEEPASGRLISVLDEPGHSLNEVYLRTGRWIDPAKPGEVIVSEAFAAAHHLHPGDSFRAIVQGNRMTLTVAGTGLSPEYIYEVRPGELLPDNLRFGVMWMAYRQLAQLSDLDGSFNSVSLQLMRGASVPDVLRRLDTLIAPYGGAGSYTREDQISHRMVSDEMTQLRAMATLPTSIFLGVAAFLLNVVLARLISTQREQIAMIKAFGYSGREVGLHYAKLAGSIAFTGCVAGIAGGTYIGQSLTRMYSRFFHLPVMRHEVELWQIAVAILVTLGAAGIGVFKTVRKAAALPPAEAMRPEAPVAARITWLEKFGVLGRLSQSKKISIRNLAARPLRTLLSIVGISMALGVLILGTFTEDIVNVVLDTQFQRAQRQDFSLALMEPSSEDVLHDLENLPGVGRTEVFRSVSTRIRSGHRWRRVGLMGYEGDRVIYPVLDMDMKPIAMRDDGILISKTLAEILHVRPGDSVQVEVLEGRRPVANLIVRGLVNDFAGLSAYMRIEGVWRLLEEGPTISGAHVKIDPQQRTRFYREVKNTPAIAAVNSKGAMLQSFRDTMAENLLTMKLFNVGFACIIAFGVVYNSARIAASERSREFATLRVLGFSRQEVSRLFLGEVGSVLAAGLPIGLLCGYGFAVLAVVGLQTESQRFPLVILRSTYAFALSVITVASVISSLWVRRKLDKLDLIGVLKARD
ncbi:MAG: FtsX-like permease family protein [Prosthecobacter sp.]